MRALHLDCFSGISGDMTVGALIDAGADLEALRAGIDSLGLAGCSIAAEKVKKKGLMATQFRVIESAEETQPQRRLHHIAEIIGRAALPEAVQRAALETFTLLAGAEAEVHGVPIDEVHFHEVGAVDSIVDIVAAQYAFGLLGIEHITASALHVGSGTVQCAHGVMPVPAPATAKLLEGKPIYGGAVEGELVTPTGAAIVAQRVASFGALPEMTVTAIGYGSGTRELPDRANVLRVLLGETADAGTRRESIVVVEATIDDMNPELLPPLITALMDHGARDAFITAVTGKKGRPGYCLTVLCDESCRDAIARIVFHNSSTLGLRMRREERIVLERAWQQTDTPWGAVRVKIGTFNEDQTSVAPEFEDCRAVAEAAGVPVRRVYEAALAAALKGEMHHA